jgi:hypothetical protein
MPGDKRNLAEALSDALSYMGPGLVAALGSEDPKQIYQAYNQGLTAMDKKQEDRANRALKQQELDLKLRQQTNNQGVRNNSYEFGFVDRNTGATIRIDKQTGKAYDLSGKEVTDVKNIVEGETFRKQMAIQAKADEMRAAQAAKEGKEYKPSKEDENRIDKLSQSIQKMDRVIQAIDGGMNLSGFTGGNIVTRTYDSMMGNPEASIRNDLQGLIVDSALINTAQTKGAISNQEMELFLSDAPDFLTDDEQKIRTWTAQRRQAYAAIVHRLQTGKRADFPATPNQMTKFNNRGASKYRQGELDRLKAERERRKNAALTQSK